MRSLSGLYKPVGRGYSHRRNHKDLHESRKAPSGRELSAQLTEGECVIKRFPKLFGHAGSFRLPSAATFLPEEGGGLPSSHLLGYSRHPCKRFRLAKFRRMRADHIRLYKSRDNCSPDTKKGCLKCVSHLDDTPYSGITFSSYRSCRFRSCGRSANPS